MEYICNYFLTQKKPIKFFNLNFKQVVLFLLLDEN